MRRFIKISLLFCILILSSCTHKELCIHHPHGVRVHISFDWKDAPEADPKGMCVIFYPVEGGQPRRYDLRGTEGGDINITVGRYNVISYNNDTEAILFGGKDSFSNYYVYTRTGDIFEPVFGNGYNSNSNKSDEDQKVVITPDMMWGCVATEVEILDNTTPEDIEVQRITLSPTEYTSIYTYKIINVTNLQSVTQMCATISGMSRGLNISTQELDTESVTLPLEAYFNTKEGIIYGRFITFGHHEENPDPHKMELYVWLNDGQKLLYGVDTERFNVTEQVHAAPNKRRVNIVIDGLDFPQAIEGDTGFKPSVDDWITEDKEIIM